MWNKYRNIHKFIYNIWILSVGGNSITFVAAQCTPNQSSEVERKKRVKIWNSLICVPLICPVCSTEMTFSWKSGACALIHVDALNRRQIFFKLSIKNEAFFMIKKHHSIILIQSQICKKIQKCKSFEALEILNLWIQKKILTVKL